MKSMRISACANHNLAFFVVVSLLVYVCKCSEQVTKLPTNHSF
jgi:hypothetical protein